MRILLTNNHLMERAGSELFVTELAEALRARGHTVAIFTLFAGAFADEHRRRSDIPVLTPLSGEELTGFAPDVLHVVHWPTLLFLRSVGVDAPCAFGFLGVIPPLENPPPVTSDEPPLAWCVSEEVAANVSTVDGWPAGDGIEIVRTTIAPGFEAVAGRAGSRIERMAVVSNHFPPRYRDLLTQVCDESGIELDVIGLPDNPQEITPDRLASFDAVVTLGRTAIAAAAMGTPVLILDSSGSDGWLTPASLRRTQQHNYSGRGHGLDPDLDTLRAWFRSPPTTAELAEVADVVRRDHDFGVAVDRIEGLLERACHRTGGEAFGRHTGVVTESLHRIAHQGSIIDHLTFERDRAEDQLRAARADAHQAAVEREAAVAERDDARHALDTAHRERDDAQAEIAALRRSTSWRVTAPLRAVTGRLRRS